MNPLNSTAVGAMNYPAVGVNTVAQTDTDALATLNELMVKLTQMMSKQRDILREYNQLQQVMSFKLVTSAYATRMESIKTEFEAKNSHGWGEIVGGGLGTIFAGFGVGTGISPIADLGRCVGETTEGVTDLHWTNEGNRDASRLQVNAEYQQNLADQQSKYTQAMLEQASGVSHRMAEVLGMLIQMHGQVLNGLQMR